MDLLRVVEQSLRCIRHLRSSRRSGLDGDLNCSFANDDYLNKSDANNVAFKSSIVSDRSGCDFDASVGVELLLRRS